MKDISKLNQVRLLGKHDKYIEEKIYVIYNTSFEIKLIVISVGQSLLLMDFILYNQYLKEVFTVWEKCGDPEIDFLNLDLHVAYADVIIVCFHYTLYQLKYFEIAYGSYSVQKHLPYFL